MEIIKLNLIPNGVNPTCHAKQYDEGRVIRFELFDGLTPYTLQSGDTVTLNLRKPDNTIIETSVTATQGNKYVDLVTTEQMCACVGYNLGTFKIANGSVDIGTLNFIMAVERDVLADGIPSQSVIEDLDALVEEAVGDNFYNKSETDALLDAKADKSTTYTKTETDTALNSKADNSDITDLQDQIDTIKDITLVSTDVWSSVSLTLQNGYYYYVNGEFNSDNSRRCAKLSVNEGDTYKLTTYIRPATISGLIYFNSNDQVVAHYLDGTGTAQTITDYEFTIPSGVASIAIQSADYRETLSLQKYDGVNYDFAAYTKSETDQRLQLSVKYGLRWDIDDPDDLGERCFGAVGLSASIGIGSTNGYSDFDNIYPWSEMKRCNIKVNANGAKIVTFEGETGFALDGTNGDVFVRIPKFYIEKYQKGGYEYRTISATGAIVHPLFIENGEELDEVFISAFEGYVDNNDKLRSIGGVIPTSNITAQEFLTAAQSNGDNYSLYDMRCVDAIWTLLAVEFGCRNTNQILGYGLADFEQPTNSYDKNKITTSATNTNTVRTLKWTAAQKLFMPVGSNITVCDTEQTTILTQAKITACVDSGDYTDWTFDGDPIDVTTSCFIGSAAFITNWCENSPSGALSWHTGRNNWITTNANTKNSIRYRWIENVVGNLWHFLPDITFNNLQMYICRNMKDYVMHKYVAPYEPVSDLFTLQNDNGNKSDVTGSNYWITELNNDIFAKGVLFGRTYDKNLVSTKAFGGYYYLYNGTVVISNGGGFDHLWRCNMLTQRAWQRSETRWYLYGARMMYKNIS